MGELASECETERARMLTAKYRPDDSITLTKGLPITVRRLSGDRLALSVTPVACHLSQRERLWRTGKRKKPPWR